MRRFFINQKQCDEGRETGYIKITGSDVNHLNNVLRLSVGEELILCGSEGKEYHVAITSMDKDMISTKIIDVIENSTEPKVKTSLYQGIPKGDKMDYIIQKSVELGVNRIIPVIMERTVVRFESLKDKEKKQIRWQKIAMEAAKQCGRGEIPEVILPIEFKNIIFPDNGLKFIPYENEIDTSLKQVLKENTDNISFIIGPEGGIATEELNMALEAGFKSVTLGKRILRTETAPLYVLSCIRYEMDD